MGKNRLHPAHVIQFAALVLLTATWVLGLAGFLLGKPRLYAWAGWTFAATLAVALTPLAAFAVGLVIERISRARREQPDDRHRHDHLD